MVRWNSKKSVLRIERHWKQDFYNGENRKRLEKTVQKEVEIYAISCAFRSKFELGVGRVNSSVNKLAPFWGSKPFVFWTRWALFAELWNSRKLSLLMQTPRVAKSQTNENLCDSNIAEDECASRPTTMQTRSQRLRLSIMRASEHRTS